MCLEQCVGFVKKNKDLGAFHFQPKVSRMDVSCNCLLREVSLSLGSVLNFSQE